MRRTTTNNWPWTLHPAWGIYLAALTLALTVRDETERQAAAQLARNLADEQLQPVRARPGRTSQHETYGLLGDLIRETLTDKLRVHGEAA